MKSHLYSRVYAGRADERRGSPLTFETANQQQFKKIQNFEKVLNGWTDVYLVGKGNMLPIRRVERERQGAIDRMNSRYATFERKEMTDYNSYCSAGMLGGMRNPVKCREFVNGRQRRMDRELKRRERDLIYIKGRNETCLLYTSPSPRDGLLSRMPSSA